jgi:hypothetical protein
MPRSFLRSSLPLHRLVTLFVRPDLAFVTAFFPAAVSSNTSFIPPFYCEPRIQQYVYRRPVTSSSLRFLTCIPVASLSLSFRCISHSFPRFVPVYNAATAPLFSYLVYRHRSHSVFCPGMSSLYLRSFFSLYLLIYSPLVHAQYPHVLLLRHSALSPRPSSHPVPRDDSFSSKLVNVGCDSALFSLGLDDCCHILETSPCTEFGYVV